MEQYAAFLASRRRAVLVTQRPDARLQSSPVAVVVADDGALLIATARRSAKAVNIRRDDRVSLCLLSDDWYGPWMHVDGKAEVVTMPEALPFLMEYQLMIAPDFQDWDAYRRRMADEDRVAIRIVVTGATEARSSTRR